MKKSVAIELIMVKSVISATFVAWWLHPAFATPIAIVGNLVWLWLTPVLEDLRHKDIMADIEDLKKELEDLKGSR